MTSAEVSFRTSLILNPPPSHQFKDETISGIHCPEDHLIDYLLLQGIPVRGFRVTVDSLENRSIARAYGVVINIIPDEVEEGS